MKLGPAKTPFQKKARKGSRHVFDHDKDKRDWVDGRKQIWDHVTRPVREDDREAFSLMKPGTRYGELPARLRRYRSDIFNDKYNKLPWDDLSRSITAHIAKDGYWYIHPGENRTLTVRESARIQTFPDSFRFAGTRSHAWRQIGNAVPPALGEALGRAILESHSSRTLSAAQSPTRIRQKIQKSLLTWGKEDANIAPWRHPGDPWQVTAGVVLGDRVGMKDEVVQSFLREFPAVGKSISTRIRAAAKSQPGRLGASYLKLADVAKSLSSSRKAWESGKAFKAAGLGESERAFVATVGLGEDHVLFTAPILRVVGRLNGVDVEGRSADADLRMLVGQLVGGSEQSPGLMAALRALGRGVCTSEAPDCRQCSLKKMCLSVKGRKR